MDTFNITWKGTTIKVPIDVSASWLEKRFDIPVGKVLGVTLPNEIEIDLIDKSNSGARQVLKNLETVLLVSPSNNSNTSITSNSANSDSNTSWKQISIPNKPLESELFNKIKNWAKGGADFKVIFEEARHKNVLRVERFIINATENDEMWFYAMREPDYTVGISLSTKNPSQYWIGKPINVRSLADFTGGTNSDIIGVTNSGSLTLLVRL